MKKLTILTLCYVLIGLNLFGQTTIVPFNDTWKYLDNGSNQGTAWRNLSFDDAAWNSGNGKLGYGTDMVNTTVSYGPDAKKKYITTYFRKTINIANPAAFAYYNAYVHRDDGLVVYVNGAEVFRNNMPSGNFTYDSLATGSPADDGASLLAFTINKSFFVAGNNVIAVEIHQNKISSSDILFDFKMTTPDLTLPKILTINRELPLNMGTPATSLTYRVTVSEPVTGVGKGDFVLTKTGTATGTISTCVQADGDGTLYDVTLTSVSGSGTLRVDLKSSGTGITDLAGNVIASGAFTAGQLYFIDQVAPTLSSINRQSPAAISTSASSVIYRVNFSEPVTGVNATGFLLTPVSGNVSGTLSPAGVNAVAGTAGKSYDVTVDNLAGAGTLRLDLNSVNQVKDTVGNALPGGYAAGQTYNVDRIAPTVASINRQIPSQEITTAATLTYRVSFSEKVSGVDVQDFVLTASGSATGVLLPNAVASVGTDGSTYDVTVNNISGTGNLRLDLKNAATGIQDTLANAIAGGFTAGASYFVYPADVTPPTVVSISRQSPASGSTTASSLTYRVIFSEPVSGVDASDFALFGTGNAQGSLPAGSVASFGTDHTTYDVTAGSLTGAGTLRLDLNNGATGIADTVGNVIAGGFSAGEAFLIDHERPNVVSINRELPATENTAAASVTFRIIFSEPVTGVNQSDFLLTTTGSVLGSLPDDAVAAIGTDGKTYDVTAHIQSGSGTLRLDLNANATGIVDTVDNPVNGGYSLGEVYQIEDNVPPLVTQIMRLSPAAPSTTSPSITYRISFSEAVTGVDETDLALVTTGTAAGTLAAGAVTAAGSDGKEYDVVVSGLSGAGMIRLDLNNEGTNIADVVGNPVANGFTDGDTYYIDRIAPAVVSINRQSPASESSNAETNTFRINFSEPVNSVDANDFLLSTSGTVTGTLANDAVSPVGTDGTTYDVTVSGISGQGTLRLDLKESSDIADTIGNLIAGGFTGGESYTISDQNPPTVVSVTRHTPACITTSATTLAYRVTFSEPVTGVDAADFALTTTGTVTGTLAADAIVAVDTEGTVYDVTVSSVSSDGTMRLDVNSTGTGIADVTGNALGGGYVSGESYTVDQTSPTVVNIQRQAPLNETVVEPAELTYRLVFSEPVTGVDVEDLALVTVSGNAAGTIGSVNGVGTDRTTYDVTVNNISGSGVLRLDLPSSAGGIRDRDGNLYSSGFTTGESYAVDEYPRVVSIEKQSPLATSTTEASVTYRITFTETVTGLDAADFTIVSGGSASGALATDGIVSVDAEGKVYDVTVSAINGAGTLSISLNSTGTAIIDVAGNSLAAGLTNGAAYNIDRIHPSVVSITRQSPLSEATAANAITFRVIFSEKVNAVDVADFGATQVNGTASGALAADAVSAAGNTGTEYDVTVTNLSGAGSLRLDVIGSADITDTLGNSLTSGFNTGESYQIDHIPPTVLSINRQSPANAITSASTITYRAIFSEAITGVDASNFTLVTTGTATGTIASGAVTPVGTDGATYDITVTGVSGEGAVRLDLNGSGTAIADLLGNPIISGFNTGQTYTVDPAPEVFTINRQNPAAELTSATSVVFRVVFSEPVTGVNAPDFTMITSGTATGILPANAVAMVGTDGTTYDVTVNTVGGAGTLRIDLNNNGTGIQDALGIEDKTGFHSGQSYIITQAPYVVSINRQSPSAAATTASIVTFRVTFSKKVTGVDANDFIITTLNGNARGTLATNVAMETTGTVATNSVIAVGTTGTIYDVSVRATNGDGAIRLDLKSSGTGIKDVGGVDIGTGYTDGQSYTIQSIAGQGFTSFTDLEPIATTSHTGEKPQAKMWYYAGKWWGVFSLTTGTKLFRLDGTSWSPVLDLATQTNPKPDVAVVGNVTHILLFRGPSDNSYIYSVEYDPAISNYKLWTVRPGRATIAFGTGAETATIGVDSRGRMWVCGDGDTDVSIRWSDSPYSNWTRAAVTLATGITTDDISSLVVMPGKIGVMWGNQNTRRFGFRTHTDGNDVNIWTADEVPGDQYALNLGLGMADDHINLMCSGDGTIYCALKTSYEVSSKPKLILMIRRPTGVWDQPYTITSNEGTRPNILLNESLNKLRIVYTSHEVGGDIMYRETSLTNIAFSRPYTLMGGDLTNVYNYATSTHQPYTGEMVVVATRVEPVSSRLIIGFIVRDGTPTATTLSPAGRAAASNEVADQHLKSEKPAAFTAYPNPFDNSTLVRFTPENDGEFALVLFNSLGQKLAVLKQGRGEAGRLQTVQVNGSNLRPGIYYVSLQTTSGMKTIKLIRHE